MDPLRQRVTELNNASHVKGAAVVQQLKKDEKREVSLRSSIRGESRHKPVVHDFKASLARGKKMEKKVRELFESSFTVAKATTDEQWKGIDFTARIRIENGAGVWKGVEVKYDERSMETGFVFVELYSNEQSGRKGWAYTCKAHLLVLVTPIPEFKQDAMLYFIDPKELKSRLEDWQSKYEVRRCQNEGFNSVGLLVPLSEFEDLGHVVAAGSEICELEDDMLKKLLTYCIMHEQ